MRSGSATPREEGFAKQTQVMLLGGWYAEDMRQEPGSAQALRVKKGASNLYSNFLRGGGL